MLIIVVGILFFNIMTAGLRPRATPYSFSARQKSKQKLAAFGQLPALFAKRPLRSSGVTGEVMAHKITVTHSAEFLRRHQG